MVPGDGYWSGRFRAMGSPCEVLVETPVESTAHDLARLVAEEAWRIEAKFSRYRDDNIVHRINTADGAEVGVDEETARLLDFAAELYELSDGAFDITSGALRRHWRFDGSVANPDCDAIESTLALVGWRRVRWRPPRLSLAPCMEIDFGGLGKEYAVDRAAAILRRETSVGGLVNFGGDIAVARSRRGDARWQVGIERPDAPPGNASRVLSFDSGAVATSGDAHRYVIHRGRRLGHILDPRTGWPVADCARSVTVAAPTCTQAGMLATLAILRGPQAEEFLGGQGLQFWVSR